MPPVVLRPLPVRVIRAVGGRVPSPMAGRLAARAKANAGHVAVGRLRRRRVRPRAPARGRLRRGLGRSREPQQRRHRRAHRRRADQPRDVRPALDGGAAGPLLHARARDVAGLDGRRRACCPAGTPSASGSRTRCCGAGASRGAGRRSATAATTVWNAFANVVFAVAAAGFLAMGGESHPLLTTAALIGTAAVAVALALFAVALSDDGKARLSAAWPSGSGTASRASCAGVPRQRLGRAARRLPARGRRPAAAPLAPAHGARRWPATSRSSSCCSWRCAPSASRAPT